MARLTLPSLRVRLLVWWCCAGSRIGSSVLGRPVAQIWCGLRHGHLALPLFGYGKIALRCVCCGWESPGWRWEVKHQRRRSRILHFGANG